MHGPKYIKKLYEDARFEKYKKNYTKMHGQKNIKKLYEDARSEKYKKKIIRRCTVRKI